MKKFKLNGVILFSIFLASAFVNSFAERQINHALCGFPHGYCRNEAERDFSFEIKVENNTQHRLEMLLERTVLRWDLPIWKCLPPIYESEFAVDKWEVLSSTFIDKKIKRKILFFLHDHGNRFEQKIRKSEPKVYLKVNVNGKKLQLLDVEHFKFFENNSVIRISISLEQKAADEVKINWSINDTAQKAASLKVSPTLVLKNYNVLI